MDFQSGIVKHKVPIRVVNLARFTGDEDRNKVLGYVEEDRELGIFTMKSVDLVLSDHYIQRENTQKLAEYSFRK